MAESNFDMRASNTKEKLVITYWDWWYKVGFSRKILEDIKRVIDCHTIQEEADILEEILCVFSDFISIDCVVDSLIDGTLTLEELGYKVDEDKLLYLPLQLRKQLEAKIKNNFNSQTKRNVDYLLHLVEAASQKRFKNRLNDIFLPIFGGELDFLLAKANLETNETLHELPAKKPVEVDDIECLISSFIESLVSQDFFGNMFGSLTLPDFDLEIHTGIGFAEYWASELTSQKKDKLVIYANSDNLDLGNFKATLVHELLPGHAFFYTQMRLSRPKLVDHGAMCLVEGWATWCEWNILASQYSSLSKSIKMEALRLFFNAHDPLQIEKGIRNMVTSFGYSDDVALESVKYFFQYPGYTYAYSLGALWFEELFQHSTPNDFFIKMKDNSWGDFFRIWSR
ncbi:hypothetical protein [Leptolyngbya iicbica]|uniref:DUF885 domain-containing protein n=2 Tax=Cyanophyceae TaxID=3028117 RepID=A0A4Q7EAP7_9CYAN|nr:hypothetical protein [Leptolyngbya sp. LK]RZM79681.1 hypothetical protein DYY88_13350 [Leptolyngbya sp. LK]